MRDGAWLIAWGYFQKVFVADNLAGFANAVFDPAAPQTGVNVLLGVYAFAFQIYGDFAGYSNIARGTSKLMGIELIENFRFPYLVRTPQAFWRNWHISLSTWLRDYLYIPLGGSRGIGVADAPEPVSHDGARRTLARRGVDIRPLGHLSRRSADRVPGRGAVARVPATGRGARSPRAMRFVGGDVPPHLLRLADFPRALRRADRRLSRESHRQLRARLRQRSRPARAAPAVHARLSSPFTRAKPGSTTGWSCRGCRWACDTPSTLRRATSRCFSETSAARSSSTFSSSSSWPHLRHFHLTAIYLLIIAWLPGAVIFRLPFAERDKRAALDAEERLFWAVIISAVVSLAVVLGLAVAHRYSFERLLIADLGMALAAAAAGRFRLRLGPQARRPGPQRAAAARRSCPWTAGVSSRLRNTSSAARIQAPT